MVNKMKPCAWCEKSFMPKKDDKFCKVSCRKKFERDINDWPTYFDSKHVAQYVMDEENGIS